MSAAPGAPGDARFVLRPWAAADRQPYLDLLREAWGEGSMTGGHFDWWFLRNPAGSLMSVAEIDGRVVGVASHTLARMVLDGEQRLGQFSVHATTAAGARGLGIFKALELRHEEEGAEQGSQVVLAFASAPTSPLFTGPLGWTAIDQRRVWLRPRGPLARRLAGRLAGRGGAAAAAKAPVPVAAQEPARDPGPWRVGGVELRRVERFGPAEEAAYRAAAPGLGNHIVRDAAYLNWRYIDGPLPYRAFASPNGFAVLGRKLHRGVALAYVAECIAPPREARALLRRCLAEARGAEAVALVPPAGLGRASLLALGFVPSHIALDFMGKALPRAARPLPTDPSAWRVSLGDTDFF